MYDQDFSTSPQEFPNGLITSGFGLIDTISDDDRILQLELFMNPLLAQGNTSIAVLGLNSPKESPAWFQGDIHTQILEDDKPTGVLFNGKNDAKNPSNHAGPFPLWDWNIGSSLRQLDQGGSGCFSQVVPSFIDRFPSLAQQDQQLQQLQHFASPQFVWPANDLLSQRDTTFAQGTQASSANWGLNAGMKPGISCYQALPMQPTDNGLRRGLGSFTGFQATDFAPEMFNATALPREGCQSMMIHAGQPASASEAEIEPSSSMTDSTEIDRYLNAEFLLGAHDNLAAGQPENATDGFMSSMTTSDKAQHSEEARSDSRFVFGHHSMTTHPLSTSMKESEKKESKVLAGKSGISKRKRDKAPKNLSTKMTLRNIEGGLVGYTEVWGARQRQRQAFTERDRIATARTRELRACEVCRKLKRRCGWPDSKYGPCFACSKTSPRVLKLPCFLAKPIEAELFRHRPSSGHPLAFSRRDAYHISTETLQSQFTKVHLTQDLGKELFVYVCEFEPAEGDKTGYRWKDKCGWRTMEMPHRRLTKMDETRKNMIEYIQNSRGAYLRSLLGCANEITCEVFNEALRFSAFKKQSIVRKALDLFAANRIIERDWRVCGEETLGLEVVWEPDNPWNGIIPITPIMDIQLDQIVIQGFLQPLRTALLWDLQVKIYERRREDWFEIFLAIFILLTNAEWLLSHSRGNAIRYGVNRRYNSHTLAESYFHGCKIMISHFHFICRGSVPLSLDWRSPRALEMASLDEVQLRFMEQMQTRMRGKTKHMLGLRSKRKYESELYWCHQLFFENWQPGNPWVEDEIEDDM